MTVKIPATAMTSAAGARSTINAFPPSVSTPKNVYAAVRTPPSAKVKKKNAPAVIR